MVTRYMNWEVPVVQRERERERKKKVCISGLRDGTQIAENQMKMERHWDVGFEAYLGI